MIEVFVLFEVDNAKHESVLEHIQAAYPDYRPVLHNAIALCFEEMPDFGEIALKVRSFSSHVVRVYVIESKGCLEG